MSCRSVPLRLEAKVTKVRLTRRCPAHCSQHRQAAGPAAELLAARSYCSGCGFHSGASFCASAICSESCAPRSCLYFFWRRCCPTAPINRTTCTPARNPAECADPCGIGYRDGTARRQRPGRRQGGTTSLLWHGLGHAMPFGIQDAEVLLRVGERLISSLLISSLLRYQCMPQRTGGICRAEGRCCTARRRCPGRQRGDTTS
jgi:hypothetical protein